jgi:hypothetical protein
LIFRREKDIIKNALLNDNQSTDMIFRRERDIIKNALLNDNQSTVISNENFNINDKLITVHLNKKIKVIATNNPVSINDCGITSLFGDLIPMSLLENVKNSPMRNGKFRIKAKIVDLLPRNCKLSRYICTKCKSRFLFLNVSYLEVCNKKCECPDEVVRSLMFSILLLDSSGFLPVIVSGCSSLNLGPDAVLFLGVVGSSNTQSKNLEKIVIIKDGKVEGIEFELLVESYEIEENGMIQKRFKLFNTCIN